MEVLLPEELAGLRLDQALARILEDYSRNQIARWIQKGHVRMAGKVPKPKVRVRGGEVVEISIPEPEPNWMVPQAIPLKVVYEDADLIVIDKPAGLVVHPAAGHATGTLQNALLHHFPELERLPRSGIVHRLDKETSGLLVVARSERAHRSLVEQLQRRTVSRIYAALVHGVVKRPGTVSAPIGRHPRDRKRFAVVEGGKEAITHYEIERRFPHCTLLQVRLETGRTHQIRVHMASIGHPLVGDPQYGKKRMAKGVPSEIARFPRQALHAKRLALIHPDSGEGMVWESPLPEDFGTLLHHLQRFSRPESGA